MENLLRQKKNVLRSELIFENVATKLIKFDVINPEEYQRIMNKPSDPERIDCLLEHLYKKDKPTIENFINVITDDYPWLAQSIIENITIARSAEDSKVFCNNNCVNFEGKEKHVNTSEQQSDLNRELTREMINIVKKNQRVSRSWTNLAHALNLTKLIHSIRVKVNINDEDIDGCVVYLLQEWKGISPKEAKLNKLISVLREEEFNDVADELEARYA